MNLDVIDLQAYLFRYPVVMMEETGGIPYSGNYNSIYENAMDVGVRNKRKLLKGLDVPLRRDLHLPNNGFATQGEQEDATGPETFFDLAIFWYEYAKSYVSQVDATPPMFLKLEVPGDRYFDTLQFVWTDRDTGGATDWSAFAVRVTIPGYCSVGDVIADNSELVQISIENNKTNTDTTFGFKKAKHLLFAHKSICLDCPPQEIFRFDEKQNPTSWKDPLGVNVFGTAKVWGRYGPRRIYIAKAPSDLYQPLGIFVDRNVLDAVKNNVVYNQSRYDPGIVPLVKPVAVLKTALYYYEGMGPLAIDDRDNKSYQHLYTHPTLFDLDNMIVVDSPTTMFLFNLNPEVAFARIMDDFMTSNSDYKNYLYQNLNGDVTKKHDFFRGLCSVSPKITKYPDICACLGNGNEEADYKRIVPSFTMTCNNPKCVNGTTAKGVYMGLTSEALSTCPPINLCEINLKGTALEKFIFANIKTDCSNLSGATCALEAPPKRWLQVSMGLIMILVTLFVVFAFIIKK